MGPFLEGAFVLLVLLWMIGNQKQLNDLKREVRSLTSAKRAAKPAKMPPPKGVHPIWKQ